MKRTLLLFALFGGFCVHSMELVEGDLKKTKLAQMAINPVQQLLLQQLRVHGGTNFLKKIDVQKERSQVMRTISRSDLFEYSDLKKFFDVYFAILQHSNQAIAIVKKLTAS